MALPTLTSLDLSGNPLNSFGLIAAAPNLTEILLNNCGLKKLRLTGLPNLHQVNLYQNGLTNLVLSPDLTYIHFNGLDSNPVRSVSAAEGTQVSYDGLPPGVMFYIYPRMPVSERISQA